MNVYDLSLPELAARLEEWGFPAYRAKQLHHQLWRRAATYDEMSDLPLALRARLATELPPGLEVLAEREADGGATCKALLRVGGRHSVETVRMEYPDRVTACVSSQAGCAMGCTFCATGLMGLGGNLSPGEIASQVLWANRAGGLGGPRRPVSRVVFMGMGEPLANYRQVRDAVAQLMSPEGLGLGARHITVSTVGLVPGIRRLADDHPQVGLAVSLHAASDELRDELVPVNRRWPLAEVEKAMAYWRDHTHRRPSIEWALIDGVNDGDDQARLLAPIAYRLQAHVNLIPMNPIPGSPAQPSSPGRMRRFLAVLRENGVRVTVRDTRGKEIEAACGQLYLGAVSRREAGPPIMESTPA